MNNQTKEATSIMIVRANEHTTIATSHDPDLYIEEGKNTFVEGHKSDESLITPDTLILYTRHSSLEEAENYARTNNQSQEGTS